MEGNLGAQDGDHVAKSGEGEVACPQTPSPTGEKETARDEIEEEAGNGEEEEEEGGGGLELHLFHLGAQRRCEEAAAPPERADGNEVRKKWKPPLVPVVVDVVVRGDVVFDNLNYLGAHSRSNNLRRSLKV